MYKLLFSLSLVAIFVRTLHAAYPFDPLDVHQPIYYTSHGVYISSNVPAASTQVVISTTPSILHSVVINTAGTSSTAEIYNGNQSTSTFKNKIAKIDTTSKVTLLYDVYCSSGISFYNYGTTPGDVTVTYLFKR